MQITIRSLIWMVGALFLIMLLFVPFHVYGQHGAPDAKQPMAFKPTDLECDSLVQPIGDDSKQPLLSWKLQDDRHGAKQTAYQILVANSPDLLTKGKADVWDSGRVASSQSVNVAYGGPELAPEKRYYWRVQAWDKDDKSYPVSEISWWETGLLDSANWHAQWIGYEDLEHRSVRAAAAAWITNPAVSDYKGDGDTKHDFRLAFDLAKPVKKAVLYATGEDAAAAWINGQKVLNPAQRPAWGRLPWRTYARQDVTAKLQSGKNLLAVEILHYGGKDRSQTPMNSALYIEMADGSSEVLKTGDPGWKCAFNATGEWYTSQYSDDSWSQPIAYASPRDVFGGADAMGIPLVTPPVTALRRAFSLTKPIVSARLYAAALGAYKIHMNGKTVGDQILSPGWTDYRQRAIYQAYDVTSLVQRGENAIGAYLAPGWYATPLEWIGQGNNYGATPPALKAQLRIEHPDGSVDWIVTDDSWKAGLSPIRSAEIYDGETFDARLLQAGWDTASFTDTAWNAVAVVHPHEPEINWQFFQPIRAKQMLAPKAATEPSPGVFIYDFGQNLAGFAKIQVQGKTGTDVQLRFGEQLNPDGTLFVANLRNAKATDHFILAGKGTEEYQPSFTFHGFRYLEISGVKTKSAIVAVKAVVVHTDAPETAKLQTGSPMVNQLWSNILWGQRSNFVGVPTDCPQRDERLGWAGDAQVFWRTATFNMDLAAFSRKYAADLRGTQVGTAMFGIYAPGTARQNPGFSPGWSDAGVVVPWTSWMQNGDTKILEQNWDAMVQYLEAIQDANPDYLWQNNPGIGFGDWLSPEGETSKELIATAYWAYDVHLMQSMARALGKTEADQKYAAVFEKIKEAFNRKYVHPGGLVGWNLPPHADTASSETAGNHDTALQETQTAYVLALHMNLLPTDVRPLAAKRLVDRIAANGWHLGTGFLGTPYLLEVLTDTGHADAAYRLLLNTTYPSWGYMVEHGATTMWERWNGDQMRNDPGMNSYNHYAYGAVAEWIYRYAAGIDTVASDAGFHTIRLHPNFDARLSSLDFSYESPYGKIRSAWSVAAGEATWKITIPPNTTGHLPLSSSQSETYIMDGKVIGKSSLEQTAGEQNDQTVYILPAGTYSFKIKITQRQP